jgi:hypothetical protein
MTAEKPSLLFLNEVFMRLAKLRVVRTGPRSASSNRSAQPRDARDFYFYFANERDPNWNTPIAERDNGLNKIIIPIENDLRFSVPYQFLPEAASVVMDEENVEILHDFTLPAPNTWVNIADPKNGIDKTAGALLKDTGKGEISVTLFYRQIPANLRMSANTENALAGKINHEAFENVRPLFKKLDDLGRHAGPLIIIPGVVFNKERRTILVPDQRGLLLFESGKDGIPVIADFEYSLRDISEKNYDTLDREYMLAASLALHLAHTISSKDRRIKIGNVTKPRPSEDNLLMKLGKAPKRSVALVTPDPDFNPKTIVQKGANTAETRPSDRESIHDKSTSLGVSTALGVLAAGVVMPPISAAGEQAALATTPKVYDPSNENASLFLNGVLQRIAKIQVFTKSAGIFPYMHFGMKTPMFEEKRQAMRELLTQIEIGFHGVSLYQLNSAAASVALNDKKTDIRKGVTLPSAVTWINMGTQELGSEDDNAALLIKGTAGTIHITLFSLMRRGEKSLSEKALNIMGGVMGVLSPFGPTATVKRKLAPYGKFEKPLLVIPNLFFDGKKIIFPTEEQQAIFPIFYEGANSIPSLINFRDELGGMDQKDFELKRRTFINLAEVSLRLANAIVASEAGVGKPQLTDLTELRKADPSAPIALGSETSSRVPEILPSQTSVSPPKIDKGKESSEPLPPTDQLADFIIESGNYATGMVKPGIRAIGRELVLDRKRPLSNARRFYTDQEAARIRRVLQTIPFEDFVRQFNRVEMPVDQLWIEETLVQDPSRPELQEGRVGFLFKKAPNGIKARWGQEFFVPGSASAVQLKIFEEVRSVGTHIRGNRYIIADELEITLTSSGVSIDYTNSVKGEINGSANITEKEQVDDLKRAEDIFRLLVIACGPNKGGHLVVGPVDWGNKESGKIQHLPIRMSETLERALSSGNIAEAIMLLGWTDALSLSRTQETRRDSIELLAPAPVDLTPENAAVPEVVQEVVDLSLPDGTLQDLSETPEEEKLVEEMLPQDAAFANVIVDEANIPHTDALQDDQAKSAEAETRAAASVTLLTEDEQIERELKRIDAFEEAQSRSLADARMYLAQAQNQGFNNFECRLVLNRPGFPIQLIFTKEEEIYGEKRMRRADYTLFSHAEPYSSRGIPLLMNDAVDLKVLVQSMICNTEGIVFVHRPSAAGFRAVELDGPISLPIKDYNVIQRSGGMFALILETRDPYTRTAVYPSIPLGLAARHEDEIAEKMELEARVDFIIDALLEADKRRTDDGCRIIITKRDVLLKFQAYLAERNQEWVTRERLVLQGFETNIIIHESLRGDQKITLAPVVLRMDVGGDNPAWHCDLGFYIGDKNKSPMGKLVRSCSLNLHTRNPELAVARSLETLKGARWKKSGNVIAEGFLPALRHHMRTTDHEWRLEAEGTSREAVYIGDDPLQFFLDDMMRYEHDIRVRLDKREIDVDSNVVITLNAVRSQNPDHGHSARATPEYIHESEDGKRKLVSFDLTIPSNKSDKIAEFVSAVSADVFYHAGEAYSSIALGADKRKKPLEYRTSQIRQSVIRAIEELHQQYFDFRLPKNWHSPEKAAGRSSKPLERSRAYHQLPRPVLLDGSVRSLRHFGQPRFSCFTLS